jgi:hypothetical protein
VQLETMSTTRPHLFHTNLGDVFVTQSVQQDMVPSLRSGVPTLKILVKFGNVTTHSERFITINTIIDEGMA